MRKIFEAEDKSTEKDKLTIKPETSKKVKDMLGMPYEEFMKNLTGEEAPSKGTAVADVDVKVKAILNLGLQDLKKEDEVIPVSTKKISVKNLQPTQSQIGLNDSIGWIAFVKPENAKSSLGNAADFGGAMILTANEKYILDGHHRWSQVYLLNPDATIPALDLTLNVKDEKEMLKVIQLAIAATYKKILMKAADAPTDIFSDEKAGANCEKIPEMLKKIFAGEYGMPKDGNPENVTKFKEILKESWETDEDGVIAKLTEHAKELKAKRPEDAPQRAIMPQPSDTAEATGNPPDDGTGKMPKAFIDKLKSGTLNFKDPITQQDAFEKKPVKAQESKKWIMTYEQFKSKK
jgi:hypothetical protein